MFGRKSKTPAPVTQKSKKATGFGALWIVSMLFLASGVLRLGDYGVAVAKDVSSGVITGDQHMPIKDSCETEEDIAAVLSLLQERELALEEIEKELADRLVALSVAEEQISKNMQALVDAENSLKATMALADGAAEKDLEQLTLVYENMKPKQAVPLFAQMDPQFAAGFLARMRSEAAAQIMSGLEPAHAYAISVILAARNANVPTN